jgi:hypothetical protein
MEILMEIKRDTRDKFGEIEESETGEEKDLYNLQRYDVYLNQGTPKDNGRWVKYSEATKNIDKFMIVCNSRNDLCDDAVTLASTSLKSLFKTQLYALAILILFILKEASWLEEGIKTLSKVLFQW